MQLQEIAKEHESAFFKMIEDYRKNDASTFERIYARKGEWSEKEFAKFLKECEASRMDWRPKAGKTSVTRYVMIGAKDEICASGVLSFPLDETTEIDGGNLSVDVPPSLRRQGYGSYCLALLLFEAVRAGLRRALVTCPEDDKFARKMIEKNRGTLQDVVASTRKDRKGVKIARYWISFG